MIGTKATFATFTLMTLATIANARTSQIPSNLLPPAEFVEFDRLHAFGTQNYGMHQCSN